MQIRITALFDEETRKQVREAVLGEVKAIARSVIAGTIEDEIKRIVGKYIENPYGGGFSRKMDDILDRAIKSAFLGAGWEPLTKKLEEFILDRVTKLSVRKQEIAKDFEGNMISDQEATVRKIAREELKRLLGSAAV